MKKFNGKTAALVIVGLILSLLVSILLHGFIMCVTDDPFSMESLVEVFPDCEGSEILDQAQVKDSAQVLLRKPDGNVFLLQFQKNALLPKYQLMDVVHIQEDGVFSSQTIFNSQISVCNQELMGTGETSFRFGTFFLLYGLNALLIFGMACVVRHFSFKVKKRK